MKKETYFNRIDDNVFNKCKTLDDLINRMNTTRDGHEVYGVGSPDAFKYRLEYFKKFLQSELPDFSELEILKIDKNFQKLKEIYSWKGCEYHFAAMEYELRKELQTSKEKVDDITIQELKSYTLLLKKRLVNLKKQKEKLENIKDSYEYGYNEALISEITDILSVIDNEIE